MNLDEEIIKKEIQKKKKKSDFPLNNKEIWEKVLESDKNGQIYKLNWIGIERTPIYQLS
jgi:hypothetical protein